MSNINNTTRNNNWTTQKLIGLSENLGQGYGLLSDKNRSSNGSDRWTTNKFIEMSRNLSSAYGVDF